MKLFRYIWLFFAAAAMVVACSDPNEDSVTTQSYKVDFVELSDTLLVFPSDYTGSYEIKLDTDAPKEKLKISYLD